MENTNFSMGEIIRSARKKRGYTQDALAQAVGISVQAVSKWETGASLPDITLLPSIADFLNISIDTLFNREPVLQAIPETEQVPSPAFPDDGKLRIVQYRGSTLVSAQEAAQGEAMRLMVEPNDSALSIEIHGSARISGDIHGSVQTQGDLYLSGSIHGNVQSQGDVHDEHTASSAKGGVSFESIFSSVFDSMGSLFSQNNSRSARTDIFFGDSLPDDDVIRVVQLRGRRLLSSNEVSPTNPISLSVEPLSQRSVNVEIYGSAQIHGDVGGSVKADDGVTCGNVGGSISAGDNVSCGDVSGNVTAGDNVNCRNVGGNAAAGDCITCSEIHGNIKADRIKYQSKQQNEFVHIRADWDEQFKQQAAHIEQLNQKLQAQSEQLHRQAERIKEQCLKDQRTKFAETADNGFPDLSAYRNGALNILQVLNGRILSFQDADAQPIRLALDDASDLTVHIHGNAEISGDICGDVRADGNVRCENMEGSIDAGSVTCGNVEGDVNAGGVTCSNVEGDVNAGGVTCENVGGDVRAEGSVNCKGNIEGDVSSGGSITCGDIGGDVRAEGNITCSNVEGDVTACGSFHCEGDIEGDIYRR